MKKINFLTAQPIQYYLATEEQNREATRHSLLVSKQLSFPPRNPELLTVEEVHVSLPQFCAHRIHVSPQITGQQTAEGLTDCLVQLPQLSTPASWSQDKWGDLSKVAALASARAWTGTSTGFLVQCLFPPLYLLRHLFLPSQTILENVSVKTQDKGRQPCFKGFHAADSKLRPPCLTEWHPLVILQKIPLHCTGT